MTDRRELVKVLRASARTHGVAQVRDDASRDKVMQMVTALRAKSLERDDRKALEDIVEKYLQTFSDGQAAVAQGEAQDSYRLRGCSFLLTFNWLFTSRSFPDGTPPAASNAELWRTWRDWKARKKKELGVTQSSSKMEVDNTVCKTDINSPNSARTEGF